MRKTSVFNEAYMLKPRRNRLIVLEGLNFFWDEPELEEIVQMWELGESLSEMAEYFARDPDEVFLALFHLGREGKITRRDGGLFGGT